MHTLCPGPTHWVGVLSHMRLASLAQTAVNDREDDWQEATPPFQYKTTSMRPDKASIAPTPKYSS